MPSTNLQTFVYPATQAPIRLARVDVDGTPWFVAKDVCGVLGIAKTDTSVALLDDDEKGSHTVGTPGGPQEMQVISESGLYSLILRSRKPEAKRFKRWLTHEVLPSIRKTGGYNRDAAEPNQLLAAVLEGQQAQTALLTQLLVRLDRQLPPPSHTVVPQDRQNCLVRRAQTLNNGSAVSTWRRVCDVMGYPRTVRMFSVVTEGDIEQVKALVEGAVPQDRSVPTERRLPAPTQPTPAQAPSRIVVPSRTVDGQLKVGVLVRGRMTKERLLAMIQRTVSSSIDESTLDSLIRQAGVYSHPWIALNGMNEKVWDQEGLAWLAKTYRDRSDNVGRNEAFDPNAEEPFISH